MIGEMKVLQVNEEFQLKARLDNETLELDLSEFQKGFTIRSFRERIDFENLPASMKKNFSNMNNILSYLTEPTHYTIKKKSGIINLCSVMHLQNGMSLQLSVGQFKLSQVPSKRNNQFQAILPLVFSENNLQGQQVKKALQFFCRSIYDISKEIHNLQKTHQFIPSLIKQVLHEKLPNKSSLAIPKLSNDLEHSTNETDLTNSNQQLKNKEDLFDEETGMEGTYGDNRNLELQLIKQKRQINFLKTQIQENKNHFLKKIAKVQKKFDGFDRKIAEIIDDLEKEKQKNILGKLSRLTVQGNNETQYQQEKKKTDSFNLFLEKRYLKKKDSGFLTPGPHKSNISYQEGSQSKDNSVMFRSADIDLTSSYISNFDIHQSLATYTGDDWTKTQILGVQDLRDNPKFKIHILKTKRRYLWVGVSDSSYKNMRWGWGKPNWVYYCGWNAKVYEGPDKNIKAEGTGFRQDQILEVTINQQIGEITWQVNGQIRAKHQTEKLKDKQIQWVPLVKFFDQGDCVQWIENQNNDDVL